MERGRHPLGQGVEDALVASGVGATVGAGRDGDRAAGQAGVVQQPHPGAGAVHVLGGGGAGGDPDGVADALDQDDGAAGAEQRDGVLGELARGLVGVGGPGQGQLGLPQAVQLGAGEGDAAAPAHVEDQQPGDHGGEHRRDHRPLHRRRDGGHRGEGGRCALDERASWVRIGEPGRHLVLSGHAPAGPADEESVRVRPPTPP